MRRAAVLALSLGVSAGPALAGPPAVPRATAQALAEAAFAPGAGPIELDPIGRILDRQSAGFAPDAGVGQVRLTVENVYRGPGLLPTGPYRADLAQPAYEVALVRRWPGAFSLGALDVAVLPHAGVGVTSFGAGSAEAGATVQLSRADLAAARLKALGVRDGA